MIEPARGDARWECRGRNFYHLRCLPTAGGMDPTQVTGFSDLRAEDQAAAREHIRTSPRPSSASTRQARLASVLRRQELIQRIRALMQRELENADYTSLLMLDSVNGNRVNKKRAATQRQISKLTTKSKVLEGEDLGCCCICLDEMETNERVRKLPCKHNYHVKCIDKWLKQNKCCPMCKTDIDAEPKDNKKDSKSSSSSS